MEDTNLSANLELKKELVEGIKAELKDAKSIVFVDYRGITVAEDTVMRKEFRENGVAYKVFKNRLLVRALNDLGITDYDPKMFEGTTAVAYSADEVAPARVFCKHQKELDKMAVKFGILNGKVVAKEQVEALAKIPSKDVLVAMLLGTLNAPVAALARALNAIAEKQN
ncbi:MAG: 50S ribosomal protein L10 [Clostridiales bacterium]|nr:50S ribosomal protein L10 [Clostridiales bacterium]